MTVQPTCWWCGSPLVWDHDETSDDAFMDGRDTLVSFLHCSHCGANVTYEEDPDREPERPMITVAVADGRGRFMRMRADDGNLPSSDTIDFNGGEPRFGHADVFDNVAERVRQLVYAMAENPGELSVETNKIN